MNLRCRSHALRLRKKTKQKARTAHGEANDGSRETSQIRIHRLSKLPSRAFKLHDRRRWHQTGERENCHPSDKNNRVQLGPWHLESTGSCDCDCPTLPVRSRRTHEPRPHSRQPDPCKHHQQNSKQRPKSWRHERCGAASRSGRVTVQTRSQVCPDCVEEVDRLPPQVVARSKRALAESDVASRLRDQAHVIHARLQQVPADVLLDAQEVIQCIDDEARGGAARKVVYRVVLFEVLPCISAASKRGGRADELLQGCCLQARRNSQRHRR